ncbi:GNAT family N-acetyltransferase [Planococcus shenhongbingii]|uniref:GNAT family N-acetyltransferase n=1 Tax=Planococcus shenhongbingii TaxID=3058398 RepID=UPI00262FBB7A|nr:GNAT family N-acetyltransferase [Planococcus sp. N016]WKA58291.1 GNAT family N-acetyltransferase [Planococcus sp. N016]
MPQVTTDRLKVITFELEMIEALLEGPEQLEKLIPYQVLADYPMDVYKQFFPYKIDRFIEQPEENVWEGLIINRELHMVIGDIGFKGGPDEKGEINLGYSVLPRFQGHGFATEAAAAMLEWGLEQPGVKKVTATCSPGNIASIRVLQKAGLKQLREDAKKIYWSS